MTFTTAPEDRYFEDYVVGAIHEFGSIAVEEAEAIAFAKRFDPLPLYTDSSAAEQSTSGRMIVSGWYTASLAARLFVEHYLPRVASLGSPGIDELRWLKPVRAGDTLSIRVIVSRNQALTLKTGSRNSTFIPRGTEPTWRNSNDHEGTEPYTPSTEALTKALETDAGTMHVGP